MYLIIEENPNCLPDERVFPNHGEKRAVKRLHLSPPGSDAAVWCDVAAVNAPGTFQQAFAQRVDDSSDGTAWLVFGGEWGLRFKPLTPPTAWSLEEKTQWGAPFLVLDSSGASIEFK